MSHQRLTTPLKMPITTTNCQRSPPPKRRALRLLFGFLQMAISHRWKSRIVQPLQLTVNSSCWLAKVLLLASSESDKTRTTPALSCEMLPQGSQPCNRSSLVRPSGLTCGPNPSKGGMTVSSRQPKLRTKTEGPEHCGGHHSCRRASRRVSGVMYRPSGRSSIGSGKNF